MSSMLEDSSALRRIAEDERPDVIVHLAAQAGVRYSLENPRAYVDANLVGTFNVHGDRAGEPSQTFPDRVDQLRLRRQCEPCRSGRPTAPIIR